MKEKLQQQIIVSIDARREEIIELAEKILHSPELGYREVKTAALVAGELSKLGLEN